MSQSDFTFVEDDPSPLPGSTTRAEAGEKTKKLKMLREAKEKAAAELERTSLRMDELAPEYLEKLAILTERFYRESLEWEKQRQREVEDCISASEFPFDGKRGFIVKKPSPEQERMARLGRGSAPEGPDLLSLAGTD